MSTEASVLAQVSDGLAAAVEKAAASTVLVNARRRIPASGIIWSADGVIVTADHVIERDEIEVVLADGAKLAATVIGRDPGSDIAVLKVAGSGLTPAAHAPAGSAKVGSMVLAVGRPTTEGPMASFGVVGALGGPWRTFRGTEVEGYLRSDTTFYPGFSGGPLTSTTIPAVSCAAHTVNISNALIVFTMPRAVSFSASVSAVDDGSDASSTSPVRTVRYCAPQNPAPNPPGSRFEVPNSSPVFRGSADCRLYASRPMMLNASGNPELRR